MKLHVVSWNVLAPVYMKCKYYSSTRCTNLTIHMRRPRIHKMFEWMNADVYLLQEVTQSEFVRFRTKFDQYNWFFQPHIFHYWKESSSHEWNGNAIAIKKSIPFKNLKKHTLKLSKGNRGLLITGTLNRKNIALISIHLDDVSDYCRSLQVDQLFRHIHTGSTVIIGGDLNDEHGTIISKFKEYGFYTSPNNPTYFEESPMALDYLLVYDLKTIPFWYIPPSDRTSIVPKFGSDHLPVTGVLDLSH
jgi:endonuclease/exonuclease/phosphatase family metal-dependent hydrolase